MKRPGFGDVLKIGKFFMWQGSLAYYRSSNYRLNV
jgi:hypothetical protein